MEGGAPWRDIPTPQAPGLGLRPYLETGSLRSDYVTDLERRPSWIRVGGCPEKRGKAPGRQLRSEGCGRRPKTRPPRHRLRERGPASALTLDPTASAVRGPGPTQALLLLLRSQSRGGREAEGFSGGGGGAPRADPAGGCPASPAGPSQPQAQGALWAAERGGEGTGARLAGGRGGAQRSPWRARL